MKSDRRMPLAVFLVVLASRLPFLGAGYGWDNDAWGNVECARILDLGLGGFQSRPPGYPVVVLLYSYIWSFGPWAVNGVTALFSGVAAAFFALSLGRLGLSNRLAALAALALAFTPVVYINSCNAMDYLWALAFILGALFHVLKGKPVLAGLFLGMAIGCRITSAAMWIPFAILLGVRRAVLMGFVTAITGAIAFSPVLLEHGLGYLTFSDQPFSVFAGYLPYSTTIGIWGVIGFAVGLVALASFLFAPRRSLAESLVPSAGHGREMAACIVAIALCVAAFLRLPAEAAYLIPAIPFTLLLGIFTLHRRDAVMLLAALCVSPFLFHDAPDPRGITAPGSHRSQNELRGPGPIFCMHHDRQLQMECIRKVFALVDGSRAPNVVVNAGTYFVYLTTLASPETAARMHVVRDPGQHADLYLRGYDNKIMLAYTADRVEFMLTLLPDRRLAAVQPTPLEQALIAATMNPAAAGKFYELLMAATFFVPAGAEPVRVDYNNTRGIPIYEDPARFCALPAHLRGSGAKRSTLCELLKNRSPDDALMLNLGLATERILPADEITWLAGACN